jgi:uncharacterized protein (DUF58 family)
MPAVDQEPRIRVALDDLVRLEFDARGFSLLPRQPVSSLLSGRHASRLRGRGLSFEELREYRPGDDIRSMDWKATARLRKPQVRVYSEERERPVLLVVDQRSNMHFGSARTTKAAAAAELAALGAWRALDGGDRVGAVIFGDDEVLEIRPHRSRRNVLRICNELVRFNGRLSASPPAAIVQQPFAERPTSSAAEGLDGSSQNTLNGALLRAANVAKHDHLVVLITDYVGDDEGTHKLVTRMAAHNDLLAVLVYDPLGIRFSGSGEMVATNGRERVSVPEGEKFGDALEAAFRARCDQIRERLRGIRIPILPICTHDAVPQQVLSALGRR